MSEPANGKLKYNKLPRYTPYTVVSVKCDYGYAKYSPPGSYEYTLCQTSGTWDQENPTCVQGIKGKRSCRVSHKYINS